MLYQHIAFGAKTKLLIIKIHVSKDCDQFEREKYFGQLLFFGTIPGQPRLVVTCASTCHNRRYQWVTLIEYRTRHVTLATMMHSVKFQIIMHWTSTRYSGCESSNWFHMPSM